jgi:hypothetical protein
MAETLKEFFSPEPMRRLAADIDHAYAAFATRAFVKDACSK